MKTKDLAIGGLLAAVAVMIPMLFAGTPLSVVIPPFSATIASHVPVMLAMAISPSVAIFVGIGSAIGFAMRLPMVIAARALMHVIFGGVGAYAYKKGMPFWMVFLITMPIHALSEALVVIPFGFDMYQAFFVTGLGTMMHHLVDAFITLAVFQTLVKLSILKKPATI